MSRPKGSRNKNSPAASYSGLNQMATQLDIPIQHIKSIKLLYPEGFNPNGSVIADKVIEYYKLHKDKILTITKDSFENLKKQKIANDIILQELTIAEKKGKMIAIDEIETFLKKLGLSLSNVLMTKLVTELPERVDRVESDKRAGLCKEVYNEVVNIMKTDIDKWNKHGLQ